MRKRGKNKAPKQFSEGNVNNQIKLLKILGDKLTWAFAY